MTVTVVTAAMTALIAAITAFYLMKLKCDGQLLFKSINDNTYGETNDKKKKQQQIKKIIMINQTKIMFHQMHRNKRSCCESTFWIFSFGNS